PPIVIHRHAPIRHSVKLNLEGLETRESPTSVFWLDPLVAAIVANGLMSQLTSSVPALQVPSDSTVYWNPGMGAWQINQMTADQVASASATGSTDPTLTADSLATVIVGDGTDQAVADGSSPPGVWQNGVFALDLQAFANALTAFQDPSWLSGASSADTGGGDAASTDAGGAQTGAMTTAP